MKFGVCLPNYGTAASPESISRIAVEAEAEGYESVWATDHIIVPREVADFYGYTIESLTTLAYASAVTRRVGLGTSILLVALRNPVLLAKQITALDVLSRGRVILGVASGWCREEFEYLSANYKQRGRIVDEAVRIMRGLWSDESDASAKLFHNSVFMPKPVQRGGPSIWVGGNSEAAVKRATTLGDAWHPSGPSFEDLAKGIELLKKITKGTNRRVDVAPRYPIEVERGAPRIVHGPRGRTWTAIAGEPKEVTADLEKLTRLGVTMVVCAFHDETVESLSRQVKQFAREIAPSF
ncbi:MAG: TIGR03619 family F420-dependent LLM class oxidoreductase [Candidatus Bathyarchaeia archaeon]